MVYPEAHAPCVNNSRTGWVGGVQILCNRTPPRRLIFFKKRLCRVNAGSEQMVYVYFQNPTCHRDFTITVFLIIWLRRQSRGKVVPGLGSRAGLFSSQTIQIFQKAIMQSRCYQLADGFCIYFKTLPAIGTSLEPIFY